jgi:thiol-disulfide isomerase/thioredoxin
MAAVAFGFVFHLDDHLTKIVPGYVDYFQEKVERSATAQKALEDLRGQKALVATKAPPDQAGDPAAGLPDYGAAPALVPGGSWFNSKPVTLSELRGKVVLIDFWTYSCINCLRTLPHLKAWDAAYRSDGLVILGVHTPEFAFEHVASNVGAAVKRLGIRYPVVQDNDYGTWSAYSNQYWPAEYMIDRKGRVRHVHFGEGSYDETESLIRKLLGARGTTARPVTDASPDGYLTPESYLGYERLARYEGSAPKRNRLARYELPTTLQADGLAYGGAWRVEAERIVSGEDARLRLRFRARDVYLVLGGKGSVEVLRDGRKTKTVGVDSYRLYTLLAGKHAGSGLLELRFTPGVQAYAFTFG